MDDRKIKSSSHQPEQQIYQQIVESALDWAWAINVEGVHTYSNKAVEQLLGYGVDEIVGKSAFPLIHPDDQERIGELVRKSVAKKIGWKEIAIRWVHKDGSVVYFESTAQPYFEEDGNLEGFSGIDRDITRRVEVEEALRELNQELEQRVDERTKDLEIAINSLQTSVNEHIKTEVALQETNFRYQALFEGSTEAVWIISMEDELISANQQAAKLLGYEMEELNNMPLSKFMHPDEWADAEDKTGVLLEGEVVLPYERILVKKDGQEVLVEVNLTLVRDENGSPKYFQSISRDITERKKTEEELNRYREHLEQLVEERTEELRDAQEELIRTEKLATLGELAGGLAHELRNPLMSVANSVYYLNLINPDPDESLKKYLNIISTEVQQSEKIISSLLSLADSKPLKIESILISKLVDEVLEKRPSSKNIKISVDLKASLPAVSVDSQQIRQVLSNLIENAYHAMPEGGKLSIKAKQEKKALSLSITDTGVGIAEENIGKIFKPLFSTKVHGIGLGLALSKRMMEANGGTLEVESVEGKGSTFTLTMQISGR
ncbi:PAS domain S-box protein [Chloroflexota bacterium]